MKRFIISSAVAALFAAILGYFMIIPLNIMSAKAWILVALAAGTFVFVYWVMPYGTDIEEEINRVLKISKIVGIVYAVLWVLAMLSSCWIGHTDRVIAPVTVDESFIPEADVAGTMDIYPSSKMMQQSADMAMGSDVNLATGYDVKSTYVQLQSGAPVAVTSVQHGSVWKALGTSMIPNYLVTNPVPNGNVINTEAVSADIQYDTCNVFGHDSRRAVQRQFPTLVFADSHDEIDEEGKMWEIFPVRTKMFGIFGPELYKSVVVLDKSTGVATHYKNEDAPEFIDVLVPAENIIYQFNAWGKYKGGFGNAMFAKLDCLTTSVDKSDMQDWGYLVKDNTLYIYTGVTSLNKSESNVGYLFGNLRTGEMSYLPVNGTVTEFKAMTSVESEVTEKMWNAAFPTLHEFNGEKVYVMVLHDTAYTLKRYAVISAENVEKLYIADTLAAALSGYSGKTGVATGSEITDNSGYQEIHVDRMTYHEGYMEIISKDGEVFRIYN